MTMESLETLPPAIRSRLAGAGVISIEDARALGINGLAQLPGIEAPDLVTIAKLLAAENLSQFLEPAPQPAQAGAGEDDEEDDDSPIPEDEFVAPGREFTTRLQDRHADWVDGMAGLNNDTPAHIIEQCVRRVYAEDSTKAGTAGGGTVKAEDFDGGE